MKNYQKNSIYNKYFERVEGMIQSLPPLEERYEQIEIITEDYFQETGGQLPAILLEMLGTWYMQEIYSDNRRNKIALDEFPVLSEHQMYRRNRKRTLMETEADLSILDYHLKNNSRTRGTKCNDEVERIKGER